MQGSPNDEYVYNSKENIVTFYHFKLYKSISDSVENCRIIDCIEFSIILNYLMFIIKLWMGSMYASTKP